MQKIHQKQIQRLKKVQQNKQKQYLIILKRLLNQHQQLKQLFLFSYDKYQLVLKQFQKTFQQSVSKNNTNNNTKIQQINNQLSLSLSNFTPQSISKLIFDSHLQEIKKQFLKLPDQQAKLEHFLLIMIKVLFVDPSQKLKKQKQEGIFKSILKQQNDKIKQSIKGLSPSTKVIKKPISPKKGDSKRITIQKDLKLKDKKSYSKEIVDGPSQAFDRYPFYLVALVSMYKQMIQPSKQTINFHQIQKFVMGEIISSKNQTSNTQFTIQFQQTKKQDFLLHDNGIKKLIYCPSLNNMYLCLDIGQSIIKIYTNELKNKQNFQPNRIKHNRKSPQILDIFYSDFNCTMGLILKNKTIQIVDMYAFMHRLYQKQFLTDNKCQIVIKFPDNQPKKIVFLQMYNKWLVVGQHKNQLTLIDCSKYKTNQDQIIKTSIKNQKPQLQIKQILQVIALSTICIVAGNQIQFYDQKLQKKKYSTYVHQQNIQIFKYYQQKNQFYLCGYKQKTITILKPQQRGRDSMQINTINFNKSIVQFQLFFMFNSILIIDDKHIIRLLQMQQNKKIYQVQQYQRIVKQNKEQYDQDHIKTINILKINRQNFIIYQSYMISMSLAKMAIQMQIDYEFLPYFYFDNQKQDITLCLNNQIIIISLLQAQIRQTYTFDNSNLQTPQFFYVQNYGGKGVKTTNNTKISSLIKPFVLDSKNKIFDLFLKDQNNNDGQNIQSKKYKKKLQIKQQTVDNIFYDEELNRCLIIQANQIYQVRNQGLNTFNTINVTSFLNMEIMESFYIKQKKSLIMICQSRPILEESKFKLKSKSSNNQRSSPSHSPRNQSPRSISNIARKLNSSSSSSSLFPGMKSTQNLKQPGQQFIFQININKLNQHKIRKYQFQKIKEQDKQQVIIKCLYLEDYDIEILLTDENIIYIVSLGSLSNNSLNNLNQIKLEGLSSTAFGNKPKYINIKLLHLFPPKFRQIFKFNQMYLTNLKYFNNLKTYYSLFLTTQQGFFIEIKLQKILNTYFQKPNVTNSKPTGNVAVNEVQLIDYINLINSLLVKQPYFNSVQSPIIHKSNFPTLTKIILDKSQNGYNFIDPNTGQQLISNKNQRQSSNQTSNPNSQTKSTSSQYNLVRAHNNCPITIIKKLYIQFLFTLTIGKDGFLKLWNQKQCIISLKFPSLRKQTFQIHRIQQVRTKRLIENTSKIVGDIIKNIQNEYKYNEILHKIHNQNQFQKAGYQKIDQIQPIKIDIQNKFIQEIVYQQQNYYSTIDSSIINHLINNNKNNKTVFKKFKNNKDNQQHNIKKNQLSLKKQKSFQSLLQKSKLKQIKSISIPKQIIYLRKSLEKYQKKQKKILDKQHRYLLSQNPSKTNYNLIQSKRSKSIDISSFDSRNYSNTQGMNLNLIDNKNHIKQSVILPKLKQYKILQKTKYNQAFLISKTKKDTNTSTIAINSSRSYNNSNPIQSDEQEYDNFQSCYFVKNKLGNKKANELDKIDKQFIRKQYSLLTKKHLAKKKQTVQILNNKQPQTQKQDIDQLGDIHMNMDMIIKDVRRIRYQSKYGGQRHIPKVKFTLKQSLLQGGNNNN